MRRSRLACVRRAVMWEPPITDVVGVGMNLGNISSATTGTVSSGTGAVADIFGNAKLFSTKGKVNFYLSTELKYRIAQETNTVAAAASNFGGLQFLFNAGINF